EEMSLDIKITPELESEGMLREITRLIQESRQEAGYTPKDSIEISLLVEGKLLEIISNQLDWLKRETNAASVKVGFLEKFDLKKELETDWGKILLTTIKI
ncbi:MAG: DUF5915 domain-containing protein, partial [Candidatus Parcubacteria bacterium]|nr:DUF5915 domain-containing protein [Candidatus Parcubacteria bacterium]